MFFVLNTVLGLMFLIWAIHIDVHISLSVN